MATEVFVESNGSRLAGVFTIDEANNDYKLYIDYFLHKGDYKGFLFPFRGTSIGIIVEKVEEKTCVPHICETEISKIGSVCYIHMPRNNIGKFNCYVRECINGHEFVGRKVPIKKRHQGFPPCIIFKG